MRWEILLTFKSAFCISYVFENKSIERIVMIFSKQNMYDVCTYYLLKVFSYIRKVDLEKLDYLPT